MEHLGLVLDGDNIFIQDLPPFYLSKKIYKTKISEVKMTNKTKRFKKRDRQKKSSTGTFASIDIFIYLV